MGKLIDLDRYRKDKTRRVFLLVEHDSFLAPLLKEFLENEFPGVSVVLAGDAAEARRHFNRRSTVLLIINLDPLEGNETEILQAAVRGGRQFPIIVASTHIRTKTRAVQISGLSGPGFAFLLKPYSLIKLADTIRSLVSGV